ncbi:MAG: glycosyltransferase [Calditrichaeota bacterium]|nr:glycosyltransferase [Calditrichota bacterium]
MQTQIKKQSTRSFDLSPMLKDRCMYPRLTRSAGVVLMIDAGYFIQKECERAFRQCGWQIVKIPLDPPEEFIEKLLMAVVTLRPDLLFTVNHLGFDCEGALTELIESIELPVVSWFVDSPAYILLDHTKNASPFVITPIWERHYLSFLKDFGFQHSFHLPLAGDTDVFKKPLGTVKHKYPIAFVGDSMIYAVEKWRGMCGAIPNADLIINEAAELLMNDRSRDPLVKTDVNMSSLYIEEQLTLASTVVLEATRRYRQKLVNRLSDSGLHIFGDIDGWRQYAPHDAKLHGSVDYYNELPELYGQTTVNLNFTSLQMPTAVNQRVFDVPLSGGFLLTDEQEDLQMLFNSGNIATFSDAGELPPMTTWYLARDSLRKKMIRNARMRIFAAHTYKHRIDDVIHQARRLFASRRINTACPVAVL